MITSRTTTFQATPDAAPEIQAVDALARADTLPVGTRAELVTSIEGLAALASDWRCLEQRSRATVGVFQSQAWIGAWSDRYLKSGGSITPWVIAGYRGSQLVFILPLMRERRWLVTVLRWLSEPLCQYGDAIIASGECARQWGSAALQCLKAKGGFDAIRLRHVRYDAVVVPFLDQYFRNARCPDRAPAMDLTQFANDAAYEARYTSTQRKRRKKLRKGLEGDFGPLTFEYLENNEADSAITAAVEEKSHWIDSRGRHNRSFNDQDLIAFLQSLRRSADPATRLVVSRMSAGGKPVSWEIGLRHGSTHFGFITSHISALTDYSPGRLHMDLSQRAALAAGLTTFDLMVPNDAHKESWSSVLVSTEDFYRSANLLGALYGRLYLEALRPMARRLYYCAPPWLLRMAKSITGH